ncbi:MAG: hypothetical protein KC912_25845 [Proteobacteria bacterium]|nr:hypothetical protein [Pseudomonadota bacterium]
MPVARPCRSSSRFHRARRLAKAVSVLAISAGVLACNGGSPDSVDTTAPQTQIDSGPAGLIAVDEVSFSFSGTDNVGVDHFTCRVDDGETVACTSPHTHTGLTEGPHTFRVTAVDLAGNADASPAERSFTVDTVAPETSIDSGPSGTTHESSPMFAFSSTAWDVDHFECRLDEAPFAVCTSPWGPGSLADGTYTVQARAVDVAGNVDPDPAAWTFTVESLPTYPSVAGTYQVVHEMEDGAVPDGAQRGRDALAAFLDEPGLTLLRILATTAAAPDYWTDESWGLLFKECVGLGDPTAACTAAGDVAPTALGLLAVEHLLVVADEGTETLVGSGAQFESTLSGGSAVFDNAEGYALSGTLDLTQEPDTTGLLGSTSSMALNTLTWRWAGGEQTVALRHTSYVRASNLEGAVVLHPSDGTTPSLQLQPFELSLNDFELRYQVMEQVVFPSTLDTSVDSFERLFDTVIDCESLGDRLECAGAYIDDPGCRTGVSFLAGEIVAACVSLQNAAVTSVDSWATSMASESTYAHMQTPVGDPCPFALDTATASPSASGLGSSNVPCTWTAELRDQSGDAEPVVAEWWGSRL